MVAQIRVFKLMAIERPQTRPDVPDQARSLTEPERASPKKAQ